MVTLPGFAHPDRRWARGGYLSSTVGPTSARWNARRARAHRIVGWLRGTGAHRRPCVERPPVTESRSQQPNVLALVPQPTAPGFDRDMLIWLTGATPPAGCLDAVRRASSSGSSWLGSAAGQKWERDARGSSPPKAGFAPRPLLPRTFSPGFSEGSLTEWPRRPLPPLHLPLLPLDLPLSPLDPPLVPQP